MTPEQLKASILQYAIQGKLVEQRPEEGTGEELYQQIQAEKQRLIQEKKIKKEKPLAEISEDEIPFDIPESWKWVRWGNLSFSIQYGYNAPAKKSGRIRMVRISDIQDGKVVWDSVPFCDIKEVEIPTYLLSINDILFARTGGTVGKSYIVKEIPEEAIYAGYLIRTRYSDMLCPEYLYYFMQTHLYWTQLRNGTIATAQPNCNGQTLSKMILPLPPLAEQKRIVAKIEELLPLLDRYTASYEKLAQFSAKFPEDMKKSILQYAIQGKLVEQRPEEGTGEEMYQQIQAEKQRLIQEKKIKKEKPLAEISEDEIPFDIPESWKWVRLSQIAILENGDRSSKYPVESDYVDFGIPFFGAKNMDGDVMSFENVRYISETKFSELGNGKLQDKDFICLLRGSVGKCAIFLADEQHHTGFICAQMVIIRCVDVAVSDYLKVYLSSPYYLRYIDSKVTGTAVRQLPAKELSNVLIPLPPFAEQKRIVAKIEELLPLCERLR